MKPTLITIMLAFIVGVSVAQTKIDSGKVYYKLNDVKWIKNPSLNWISRNKIWFKVQMMPNNQNPDSLILSVNKKRFRWINDSTAVVYKNSEQLFIDDLHKTLIKVENMNDEIRRKIMEDKLKSKGYF